jgi:hypothetical protein
LAAYLPSCAFALDDLRVAEDRDIAARDLAPEARLTLIVMKHAAAQDLAERVAEHYKDIQVLIASARGERRWRFLLRYM